MSQNLVKPKRRIGCLARFLIFLLFLGVCYWVFLAPIPKGAAYQNTATITPEVLSEMVVVDGEINSTQQVALEKLVSDSGEKAEVLAKNGQIQYLSVNIQVPNAVAANAQEKATNFIHQNRELFQVDNPSREFKVSNTSSDETGIMFIRYEQVYQGIPVYGSEVIVEVNNQGQINSVMAGYSPSLEIKIQPAIRSIQAEKIVLKALGDPNGQFLIPTRLVIYDAELLEEKADSQPRLAWEVMVASTIELSIRSYLVDAQTGEILLSLDEIMGGLNRNIWDTQGILVNPKQNIFWVSTLIDNSKLVMDKDGPIKGSNPDVDAKRAWFHSGTVYDYYYHNFNRDSFDAQGGTIELYVNFGYPNNSLWQPFYKKGFSVMK